MRPKNAVALATSEAAGGVVLLATGARAWRAGRGYGPWAVLLGGYLLLDGVVTIRLNRLEIQAAAAYRRALDLYKQSHHADALPHAQAAVTRRRTLARVPGRAARVVGPLAMLIRILVDLGRIDDGLSAAHEALRLRRRIASEDMLSQALLARALDDLVGVLVKLGRDSDALPLAEEAVALWREATRPDSDHRTSLAAALFALDQVLTRLDRQQESLSTQEDIVAVWRDVAGDESAHRYELAWALGNLVVAGNRAENYDTALTAAAEFVDLWRELAVEAGPVGLGWALFSLVGVHHRLGHDALPLAEETVALWRKVTAEDPSHRRELTSALAGLATALELRGNDADALVAVREGVTLLQATIRADPEQRTRVSGVLGDLADGLRRLGPEPEAQAFDEQAVVLLRETVDMVRGVAATDLSWRLALAVVLNHLAASWPGWGPTPKHASPKRRPSPTR